MSTLEFSVAGGQGRITGVSGIKIDGKPYQSDTLPADLTFGKGTVAEQTAALMDWLNQHPDFDNNVIIDGNVHRAGPGQDVRLMTHFGHLELEYAAPIPSPAAFDFTGLSKIQGPSAPKADSYRQGMSTLPPGDNSTLVMAHVGSGGMPALRTCVGYLFAYRHHWGRSAHLYNTNPAQPWPVDHVGMKLTDLELAAYRAVPRDLVQRLLDGKIGPTDIQTLQQLGLTGEVAQLQRTDLG